jgi:uncharacterized membrane protein
LTSAVPIRPGGVDRILAGGCAVLLLAIIAAIVRGRSQWPQASGLIWLHLATIVLALGLTPILLLKPRGTPAHRALGYAWVAAMTATAALSFGIRTINPGTFSPIHILSALTLVQCPLIAWYAHSHRVAAHRFTVLSMVTAALLIAGFFTFPFSRMLGRWLLR